MCRSRTSNLALLLAATLAAALLSSCAGIVYRERTPEGGEIVFAMRANLGMAYQDVDGARGGLGAPGNGEAGSSAMTVDRSLTPVLMGQEVALRVGSGLVILGPIDMSGVDHTALSGWHRIVRTQELFRLGRGITDATAELGADAIQTFGD